MSGGDADRPKARPRTGRRPGTSDSRERILEAARAGFAEHGYAGATMRSIAGDAGVDAALVVHFFGGKAALLKAAIDWPFNPEEEMPKLMKNGHRQVGRNLAQLFVTTWDEEGSRHPILILLDAATAEPQAAEILRDFLNDRLFTPLMERLEVSDPALRAQLAGSQLVGLGLNRYLLRLEPLASATSEELVDWVAPTLQRYLTGKLAAGRPPDHGRSVKNRSR